MLPSNLVPAVTCLLALSAILARTASAQSLTETKAKNVGDVLGAAVTAKFNCDGQPVEYEKDGPHGYFKLRKPCDLTINYPYQHAFAPDGGAPPAGMTFVARADRVVIQSPGQVQTLFSAPLRVSGVKQLSSSDWWASSKLEVGEEYEVRVIYRVLEITAAPPAEPGAPPAAPTEKEIDQIPLTPIRFKPVKPRWTLQLTGKVFTAWQPKSDGDVSFVMPGLALGPAVRWADDYNDQDVLAARVILAAGPNLVPRQEVTKDENGQVTAITPKQHLQVITGVELAIGRYISIGVAHGVLEGAKADGWLALLSYGELYPASSLTH